MAFDGKYLDWNQKRIKGIIDYFGHQSIFGKKVLDLGCGYGDISGALYRLGAEVTAVDIRQEHLKITAKKFPGIKAVKADLDVNWPFVGKKFDIVLDLDLVCHLFNYEAHLKSVCASADHLVLDTAVCDSDDPYKSVLVDENKNIYDMSGNGRGCRPSPAAIERVLKECGFTFTRLDLAKFNSGPYIYNWNPTHDGSHSPNKRRLWFAVKNQHLQPALPTPPTETSPAPFNMGPKTSNVLQNSNIFLPGFLMNQQKESIDNKLDKKPKVALCISGHLRTFESNFKTVKEHILDKLDCDVFIHTWNTLGTPARPGDSNLYIADTNRYANIIQQMYQPKKFIIENSKQFEITPIMYQQSREHRDIPGMLSMFYKIEECNKIRKEYEQEYNIKYDFVVRFRGDLWMESPLPIDTRTTANHLYLPIFGHFGGACDQIAFGSPEIMDKYSCMFSNFEKHLHAGCIVNPEKMLLFHLDRMGVPIAKAPIKFVIRRANGLVQDNMLLEKAWGWI